MFKRKKPLSTLQKSRQVIWPAMGWSRAFQYLKLRVVRLPESSSKIAAGLAIGVSVSFSPFMGTHLIQAALFAYLFRASVVSALIGTLAGNPWTFPFIWLVSIKCGALLFDLIGLPASTNVPPAMDLPIFWETIKSDPLRILLPWMLGGYLIGLLSWPFSYYMFYNVVKAAKIARRKAQEHKMHKAAKSITGQKKK